MINTFEIGINVLEAFLVLMFLTLYLGCKYKGIKAVVGFGISWGILLCTITFLNNLFIYEGYFTVAMALGYFLFCVFFLKGDIWTKAFFAGYTNCLVNSIAVLSILCGNIILDGQIDKIFSPTPIPERVILVLSTKVIFIAIAAVMLKFRFRNTYKKHNMFLFTVLTIMTATSNVGIMQTFMAHNDMTNELLTASLCLFLTVFLIYFLYVRTSSNIEKEVRLNLLQQKIENDKQSVSDIEQLYNKTCGVHHDLINHFETISHLMEQSTDKAQEYINTVLNNQLGQIKTMIKTGNDCFDAIANAKIARCEKYNINCRVRVMEHSLDILSHDEISVIFGNIFDNAIEAAKSSERKTINLDIQIQDDYLSVFMKNSIDESVIETNKELKTTKQNKSRHGFGIENIKRVIYRHNGILNFDEEKGYFICDILIPIQNQWKEHAPYENSNM